MNKSTQLFWMGCVPARLLMIYIAYCLDRGCVDDKYRIPFILFALFIGLPFFYRYFSGTRQTGLETFGAPIWWNHLRPVHGTLYCAYAWLAYKRVKCAYIVLVIDLIVGVLAELHHMYKTK